MTSCNSGLFQFLRYGKRGRAEGSFYFTFSCIQLFRYHIQIPGGCSVPLLYHSISYKFHILLKVHHYKSKRQQYFHRIRRPVIQEDCKTNLKWTEVTRTKGMIISGPTLVDCSKWTNTMFYTNLWAFTI